MDIYKIVIIILALVIISLLYASKKDSKNDLLKTILNRTSVRAYSEKAVSKDKLNVLIKAGMAAPSAMDKRPWIFIPVTDKSTLKTLSEGLHYGKMIETAGAAIVVCGERDKFISGVEEYWVQDCSAVSQNILLAAEATGLGAVWVGVYPVEERIKYIQKTLNIPADVIPLNVISIGYPLGKSQPKDKYDTSRIHWEKW